MHTHNHVLVADSLRWISEAVLFEQAQTGCRVCLNRLMARHERLIPFVMRLQTLHFSPGPSASARHFSEVY